MKRLTYSEALAVTTQAMRARTQEGYEMALTLLMLEIAAASAEQAGLRASLAEARRLSRLALVPATKEPTP